MNHTSKRRPTRSGAAKGNLYAWVVYMARPLKVLACCSSLLLSACGDKTPVVVSVDNFCTRVDRFHATDGEREFLKANSGPLERFIRWAAGINRQWDEACLKPTAGP